VETFRLKEDLMAVTVAEFDNLVFDRGAVPRSHAGDRTGIQGRALYVGADDLVRESCRARNPAGDLRIGDTIGHQGEGFRILVGLLHRQPPPIDRSSVESWRGSGLEPTELEACTGHGAREALCRLVV